MPSDTQMRSTLDGIELEPLHEAFADLFWELQRSGELRKWHFDDKYYLVAIDGRGYFCSSKIKCEHCLEQRKKTGSEYYHQVVAAVLVHPTRKQVVPLAVEPIEKQDGSHKNDCERNATKRLLKRLRKQHPKLNMLIIEDGLASNAAHISDLKAHGLHYLLGAKLGDHEHLFTQFERCPNEDEFASVSLTIGKPGKTLETETTFCSQSELNKSNPEVKVNFLSHLETDAKTRDVAKRFSWVTDLQIHP
ncbi:MAG: transposase, partial [Planctomycetota bacterium]